jgi:hypothetical protein
MLPLVKGANFIVFALGWQALGRDLVDSGIKISIVEQLQVVTLARLLGVEPLNRALTVTRLGPDAEIHFRDSVSQAVSILFEPENAER